MGGWDGWPTSAEVCGHVAGLSGPVLLLLGMMEGSGRNLAGRGFAGSGGRWSVGVEGRGGECTVLCGDSSRVHWSGAGPLL